MTSAGHQNLQSLTELDICIQATASGWSCKWTLCRVSKASFHLTLRGPGASRRNSLKHVETFTCLQKTQQAQTRPLETQKHVRHLYKLLQIMESKDIIKVFSAVRHLVVLSWCSLVVLMVLVPPVTWPPVRRQPVDHRKPPNPAAFHGDKPHRCCECLFNGYSSMYSF